VGGRPEFVGDQDAADVVLDHLSTRCDQVELTRWSLTAVARMLPWPGIRGSCSY